MCIYLYTYIYIHTYKYLVHIIQQFALIGSSSFLHPEACSVSGASIYNTHAYVYIYIYICIYMYIYIYDIV